MVNATYDFPLNQSAALSLGAGVGVDRIEVHDFFGSDDGFEAAVQVMAGIDIDVSDNVDLVANFRYMTTFENDVPYRDIGNTTFTVGLKFDL